MEPEYLRDIKKRVIMALFSDEILSKLLVLKGGNLLDIVYDIVKRSSVDLDFSIVGELSKTQIDYIRNNIGQVINKELQGYGHKAFDFNFSERPPEISEDMKTFWGGYRLSFKVIEIGKIDAATGSLRNLRAQALSMGKMGKKSLKVDISKHEFCDQSSKFELEGLGINIYSPEMILFEKLRAICQQHPDYARIVRNPSQSARARDFYDIYKILKHFKIGILRKENIELLKSIFKAKKVPLQLIDEIKSTREYHRMDFASIENTVDTQSELRDFDYYFDYVIESVCDELKSFWEK